MEKRKFPKMHNRRIISMIIACVILFAFAFIRLYDYQIVNGDTYLALAQKSTYTTVKIPAARGEIVDCNGIPFTKNETAFLVEFDYSFLPKENTNQLIFTLIKTFEALDAQYLDELPITATAPYEFIEGREDDVKRLKDKIGVNVYATAQNCLDVLYEMTGIKKFENAKGKCTHCGKDFEECEFEGFGEEYCRKIAGVRYTMIIKDFSAYTPRYTFASSVSFETVAFLEEMSSEFIGVDITQTSIRTYIGGDVASHIIGKIGPIYSKEELDELNSKGLENCDYTLSDLVGKSGIEKAFESELRGINGQMKVIKNSKGDVIDVQESVAPIAGKTIMLTIDYNFQKKVQEILSNHIDYFNSTNTMGKNATAASIVALDPKTGGILACVSYPYYDLNEYYTNYSAVATAEGRPEINRALNGLYRPGSTFKPVVATAALNEGINESSTTIFCDGAYHYWPSWNPPPGCLSIGHRNVALNVVSALKWSCNVFFYDTGRRLGIDKMNEYAHYFGLGVSLSGENGLEIPSATGQISNPDFSQSLGQTWQAGNVIQAAIGQLDTQVTPLQMAVEAMTIANKGIRYETHFLKQVLSYDQSEVIKTQETIVASSFDMSDDSFSLVTEGMIEAGLTVSAPNNLNDLGYDVAVKTGTPEVSSTKTNSAFVCFAPAEDAKIAISCMIEDGYTSSSIIRQILLAYEDTRQE